MLLHQEAVAKIHGWRSAYLYFIGPSKVKMSVKTKVFAYGSNMWSARMVGRVGSAQAWGLARIDQMGGTTKCGAATHWSPETVPLGLSVSTP